MRIQRSFSSCIGWLVIMCALGLTVYGQEREEVRRTFSLNPGATVSLANISGNIRITSWEGAQVEMVAIKTGPADQVKDVDISIDAKPSRLSIETEYPKKRNNNVSVSYDLKVPRNVSLDGIGSVSGSIEMMDIDGRVVGRSVSGNVEAQRIGMDASLDSVSGNVKASDVAGRVSASSVSGTAEASNVKGDLDAKSVSGNVQITRAGGYIKVESVSGNITIGDSSPANLKASTVSGGIQFDGRLNSNGRYELKSHSGKVTAILPADSGFTLEASTFSGSLKSDFEIKVREINGTKTISGVVSSGGPTLAVSSFSGTVSIRRK